MTSRTNAKPRKAKQQQAPPLDRRTHERRERVLELWGRPTRIIAVILLEEGFEVDAGPQPITKQKQKEWLARRINLMRRNVDNDRAYWLAKWREDARKPRSKEDRLATVLEMNAAINSDIDQIDELLADEKTKSSAAAMLLQSKLRARELTMKLQGIDKPADEEPPPPENPIGQPTIVIYDLSKCTDDVKQMYGAG